MFAKFLLAYLLFQLAAALLYEMAKALAALWLTRPAHVHLRIGDAYRADDCHVRLGRLTIFVRPSTNAFFLNYTGYVRNFKTYGAAFALHFAGVFMISATIWWVVAGLPPFADVHPAYRISYVLAAIITLAINLLPWKNAGFDGHNDFFRLRDYARERAVMRYVKPALAAIEAGRMEEAVSLVEPVLKRKNLDLKLAGYVNWVYLQVGRTDLFLEILRNCEATVKSDVGALHDIGVGYGFVEAYDDSLRCLEKALALGAEDPVLRTDYAYAHLMKGNTAQAIDLFEEFLQNDALTTPNRAYALANLGLAKIRSGDEPAGLALLDEAQALDPQCGYAYRNRALYHLAHNRPGEAREQLEVAQRADENVHLVRKLLAELNAK